MRQVLEYHPVIGCRYIPSLKARMAHEGGGYLVQTNALGFRCKWEFTSEKQPDTRRILLFGDSFTAGNGVSAGQRFGDLLEQAMPNLQVYNFGIPGTGTDQQYLAYQEYAKDIEHDLLIIAVYVENIRRTAARFREYADDRGKPVVFEKPYFEIADGQLVLHNVPPRKQPLRDEELKEQGQWVDRGGRFPTMRKLVKAIGLQQLALKLTGYESLPEYHDAQSRAWMLMSQILREWIELSPAPVILMPIPLHHHLEEVSDPHPYQARFRELDGWNGCLLHDPLQDLMAYPIDERRQFRFREDPHLSPKGHAALAESLMPVVQRCLESSKVTA